MIEFYVYVARGSFGSQRRHLVTAHTNPGARAIAERDHCTDGETVRLVLLVSRVTVESI